MTSIEYISNLIAKAPKTIEEYDNLMQVLKDLNELERYRNERYKHWNIFFNGAKLEYLLWLEQKGKESFMTSISEELFSKIKEHFLEKE